MKDNNSADNDYTHAHIEDLLALYALGGLTQEEILQVEAHVAQHPQAAADLAEFMKTVEDLPLTALPMKPSAEMESLLMNRVEANAAARFPAQTSKPAAITRPQFRQVASQPTEPEPQLTQQSFWEWFSGFFSQPAFSGGAVALAVLAFVWAAVLTQRLNNVNQQTATLTEQVGTLIAQNNELDTAVASTTANLESLEDEVLTLNTENAGLIEANEALVTQIDTLTADNETLVAQIDTLTTDNEALNDQLIALEGDADTLQNQLVSLNDNNQLLSDQLADQQIVLDLFASPNTQTISLPGTEARPQATGQLLVDPNSNIALLVVSDLQPLEEGQVYQVLLIRDDGHDTADTFIVDAEGENVLLVHSQAPLNDFTAVGVSIEPEGGSVQRTGDIIILGEL